MFLRVSRPCRGTLAALSRYGRSRPDPKNPDDFTLKTQPAAVQPSASGGVHAANERKPIANPLQIAQDAPDAPDPANDTPQPPDAKKALYAAFSGDLAKWRQKAESILSLPPGERPAAARALAAELTDDDTPAPALKNALAGWLAQAYAGAANGHPLANGREPCPDCGQFLSENGTCTSCRGTDGTAGANPDAPETQAAEIGKGKKAVETALATKADVHGAISRGDVGIIDLKWGNDRMGLQHIIKRRDDYVSAHPAAGATGGAEMVRKLPEVLIRGTVSPSRVSTSTDKIVRHGPYLAVLAQTEKKGNRWVLTGYEVDADAAGYRQKKGGAR